MAAFAGNAALDQRLQSAGWSRPYRSLDAQPFPLPVYSPAQAMLRSNSGTLRQSIDQVCPLADCAVCVMTVVIVPTGNALQQSIDQGCPFVPCLS